MKSTDKIFITNTHQVFTGKEAEERLKETNDKHLWTRDGILSVPLERWALAQQFEEGHWLIDAINAKDDRNEEHRARFNNYEVLKDYYEASLEIGAGPFAANTRIITEKTKIDYLTLLDPLIFKYMTHPNCPYKEYKLNGFKSVKLDNCPIEEFEVMPQFKYELIVMINVVEHTYDFFKVFEVIDNILKKGGTLVLSEATIKSDHMMNIMSNHYDAGHPLRIVDRFFESCIEERFTILYKKVFDNLYDQDWRRDYYYVLGA